MKLICKDCGKHFEGDEGEKFCHNACRDSYIQKIENLVKEAVKNDSNHTQKLSRDS